MTSEVSFLRESEIVDFPCMMINRGTSTIIIAQSFDSGYYRGVCVNDPTKESKIGDVGVWSGQEFTIFKGDVVLRG